MSFKNEILNTPPNEDEEVKSQKNKKDIHKKIQLGIKIFVALLLSFVVYNLFNPKTEQTKTNQTQQKQAKPKQATPTKKQEQTTQKHVTENKNVEQKQAKNSTKEEQNNDNNKSQEDIARDWNRQIQILFLNKPKIILDKQKPIIEINNLDIFSNRENINLENNNAYISPAYLTAMNDDIIINIDIVNKENPSLVIKKYFSLKDNGFNPLFFEDSIYFNDKIYIAKDKILFFTILSIQENNNYIEVELEFNRQIIKIVKETAHD